MKKLLFSFLCIFIIAFTIQKEANAQYCTPLVTNCNFESITNVTFSNINNTSACVGTGYSDYTVQIANVDRGSIYQVSVTIIADELDYLYLFIDWNQNQILDDAGELYILASNVSVSGTYSENITIPAGATLGNTRMRVLLGYTASTPNPCEIPVAFGQRYGEVEDYTVAVADIPAVPSLTEVFLPQFIQGLNGTNNGRIPFVYLATLTGLSANSTYRFYNLVVTPDELPTVNGAGIIMFAEPGNYRYSATGSFTNPDSYGEFTTDGSGSYTGWFVTVPSGNVRFTPGNDLQVQVLTNDGAGGTSIVNRLRSTQTVKVINWGTTPSGTNEGSFFWGQSDNGTQKNILLMYDNVDGTGRPITGGLVESIGYDLNLQSAILPAYRTNIANQPGRWGVIIPNILPTGIQRIEERALLNVIDAPGDLVQSIVEPSGVWSTDGNTVNPSNGSAASLFYNGPLPVDLISFTATTDRNNVKLSWQTAWEENNDRFEVQRRVHSDENSSWTTIGSVRGAGTTYETRSYSFDDRNLSTGKYEYRLVQFDINGQSSADFDLTGFVEIGTPERFALMQNYPNPFNPVTKIDFQLPVDGLVQVRIFDMSGREVAEIVNSIMTAGYHTAIFDGSTLASGMYFYRIEAGNFRDVKKMVLIK